MSELHQASDRAADAAQRGVDRLTFFSDAVCAIAITLVVLPLVDAARDLPGRSAVDFFTENSAALSAACISFITISLFWRDHHEHFARARSWSRALVNVNMFWLAGVCAIPLTTAIEVATGSADTLARIVYLGSILVTMILARLEGHLLVRSGAVDPADAPDALTLNLQWIAVGLMVIALALSVAVPEVGLWSLLIVVLARPIAALARRLRARRPGLPG